MTRWWRHSCKFLGQTRPHTQTARECGIYASIWPWSWWWWWKKNNLFRGVSTSLRRTYVHFDKESHGSSIHPDLNMSEFSRLAIGKSFLGKVVRFFYSLTLRRMGRRAPFYEGYLFFSLGRDLQKTITNFTPLSELPGICGEDVCLFVESESFDTGGPNTCPTAIEHFLKKGENTFQPSAFCHFLTL